MRKNNTYGWAKHSFWGVMNNIRFCSNMNSFTQAKWKLLHPSYLSKCKLVSSIKFFILPCMRKKQTYGCAIRSFWGVINDFEFSSKMNSFTQAKLKLLCPSYLSVVSSINFFILPCMTKNHTYGWPKRSFWGVMNDIRFCSKINPFTQAKIKLLCPSCLSMSKEVSFFHITMHEKETNWAIHSLRGVMHDFGFGYDKAALLEGQRWSCYSWMNLGNLNCGWGGMVDYIRTINYTQGAMTWQ